MMKHKRRILVAVLVIGISIIPFIGSAAPEYTITRIGNFEGKDCGAFGINDLGDTVGYCYVSGEWPDGIKHPFLWKNGKMIDLGILGGEESGIYFNQAYDINNLGQIVGSSQTSIQYSTWFEEHAFLWNKGSMIDLGVLGVYTSSAQGINEQGQIVGISKTSNYDDHAFLWQKGEMIDLGTLGGNYSHATGINEIGQIVGDSRISDGGYRHAFLWENGEMQDLGTLGGDESFALDINNLGQVVGYARTGDGENHAFVWEKGVMVDLAPTGSISYAHAINERGQIVGHINWHPVLWDRTGEIIYLGALPDETYAYAYAINRHGQIGGVCSKEGIDYMCLWEKGKY
jgi:probable HAF family extracellular repeat protein